jgi:hypothetical protein
MGRTLLRRIKKIAKQKLRPGNFPAAAAFTDSLKALSW